MSIGARSQSAKTYLEQHFADFEDCDLPTLIKHGLHALRDTLQQDKELTPLNVSLGIVGVSPIMSDAAPASHDPEAPSALGGSGTTTSHGGKFDKFRILEGDELLPYLASMDPKEVVESIADLARAAEASGAAVASEEVTGAAESIDAPPAAGGDSMETD
jgi:20S proteasome subunit alpha 6